VPEIRHPTTNALATSSWHEETRHPSPIRSVSSPRSGRLPDPDGYKQRGPYSPCTKGDTMMRSITAALSLLAFAACVHEQFLVDSSDGQTFGRIAIPFQTPLEIAR